LAIYYVSHKLVNDPFVIIIFSLIIFSLIIFVGVVFVLLSYFERFGKAVGADNIQDNL
jgi:hypothetical protein